MGETLKKKTLKKKVQGYGYKYVDMAGIHEYLESISMTYYQYTEADSNGIDYIWTVLLDNMGKEVRRCRGAKITEEKYPKKNKEGEIVSNTAQEQGCSITYARRYSLLMILGLATEDDDASSLTRSTKSSSGYGVKKTTAQGVGIKTGAELATPAQMSRIKKLSEAYNFALKEKYTKSEASALISRFVK